MVTHLNTVDFLRQRPRCRIWGCDVHEGRRFHLPRVTAGASPTHKSSKIPSRYAGIA